MVDFDAIRAFYRLAYNREDNDCAVRALAVACTVPYEHARDVLTRVGRPPGWGVTLEMLMAGIEALSCSAVKRKVKARTMHTLCRELRRESGGIIALTRSHVAGFWNGECIDWSRDRLLRITDVFDITRRYEHNADTQKVCHVNFVHYVDSATRQIQTVR
jgi:hypothetical protein